MKLNKIIVLCTAALILAVTPVVVSEIHRSEPITIETELSSDEIVEYVKLSRGELHFKNMPSIEKNNTLDITSEMDRQYIVSGDVLMKLRKEFSPDDMADFLGIYPELWDTEDGETKSSDYIERLRGCDIFPTVYNSELIYLKETPLALYRFDKFNLYIKSGDFNLSELRSSSPTFGIPYTVSVGQAYGEFDSRIGDMPLGICVSESGDIFSAFTLHGVGYELWTTLERWESQAEIAELLISIYETSYRQDKNAADYLLSIIY